MLLTGTRYAWIEVDRSLALKNFTNIKDRVKKFNPSTKICAVVKANSYGMGAIEMAKLYLDSGVDYLAVATLKEALDLRVSFESIGILILGYVPDSMYGVAVKNNITLAIYDYEKQAKILNDTAEHMGKIAKIHIKLETGMNRIGFKTDDNSLGKVISISKLDNVEIEGIFTHFTKADFADKTVTLLQVEKFDEFIEKLEDAGVHISIKHCANSATIVDMPEYLYDMCRPGIILLGYYPSNEVKRENLDLSPCIALKSRIVNLKEIDKDEGVGYGFTFIADKPTKIATVPLGYADGFQRILSNKFYGFVNGRKVPQVGNICMDQMMFDVSEVKDVNEGDELTLFGYGDDGAMTAYELANIAKTIPYEITSALTDRLEKVYIN